MSIPDRAAELRSAIETADIPVTWQTPDDLSRRSMEAMASTVDGRQLPSRGFLHLTGWGVRGSSALMEDVAQLMTGFQRLVAAWGASLDGFTNLRGKLPVTMTAKTKLRLVAGVAPGSVVLNIAPDMSPIDELEPGGQPALDQPTSQRLDEVLEQVTDLVSQASTLGPDPTNTEMIRTIQELGPRTASSLRAVTEGLARGGFDMDVEWAEPNKPTYRGSITARDAEQVARIITGRELDHGKATLVGQLHTSSDSTAPWHIEVLGKHYKVKRGRVSPQAIRDAHAAPGDTVRISAQVSLRDGPSGEKLDYRATSIEVVDASTPHSVTE